MLCLQFWQDLLIRRDIKLADVFRHGSVAFFADSGKMKYFWVFALFALKGQQPDLAAIHTQWVVPTRSELENLSPIMNMVLKRPDAKGK